MKKLTVSLAVVAALATLILRYSGAVFSDRETSKDNTFEAGTIDLKIDNTSYYNGQVSPATTWSLSDLGDGRGPAEGKYLFFNFNDIKPGDIGEDTVSLHVGTNDAWACADIKITKNDDNGNTEPELLVDQPDNPGNDFDGELAQNLNFVFWVDDGDNVLELGEKLLPGGPAQAVLAGVSYPLADSQVNNLGGSNGSPLAGNTTYYIGKGWCFGSLTPAPLAQDNSGNSRTPIGSDRDSPATAQPLITQPRPMFSKAILLFPRCRHGITEILFARLLKLIVLNNGHRA